MTLMYNVVDKLRAGTELSKVEREVHQLAACGTLRDAAGGGTYRNSPT